MTDRPIIFSAPMIRALLDGSKTQTRRILRPPYGTLEYLRDGTWRPIYIKVFTGDRLWVREAHALVPSTAYRCSPGVPYAVNPEDGSQAVIYREGWERSKPGTGWRPSIHMPRWASRLTLTITDVRVQRVQEISESDAEAEGIETGFWDQAIVARRYSTKDKDAWFVGWPTGILPPNAPVDSDEIFRRSYASLWDSIHGPGAWDRNDWVAALTFTVEKRNIDQ